MAAAPPPIHHPHAPGETTSDEEKEDKTLVETDAEHAKAAHAQTKFTLVLSLLVYTCTCTHTLIHTINREYSLIKNFYAYENYIKFCL